MRNVGSAAPDQIGSRRDRRCRRQLCSAPRDRFHRIWSDIWRGKSIILRTTAASLLIAILFIIVVPSQYTAVTQILIDPTDLHAVGNDLVPANQMNDLAVLQVESQVRVLTSDSMLRRVITAEALDRDPEFARPSAKAATACASFA